MNYLLRKMCARKCTHTYTYSMHRSAQHFQVTKFCVNHISGGYLVFQYHCECNSLIALAVRKHFNHGKKKL